MRDWKSVTGILGDARSRHRYRRGKMGSNLHYYLLSLTLLLSTAVRLVQIIKSRLYHTTGIVAVSMSKCYMNIWKRSPRYTPHPLLESGTQTYIATPTNSSLRGHILSESSLCVIPSPFLSQKITYPGMLCSLPFFATISDRQGSRQYERDCAENQQP